MSKSIAKNHFAASCVGGIAIALSLASAAAHAATFEEQSPVVVQTATSSLSRADVKADLLIWIAAGMDKYSREDGVDFYGAEYQKDYATYAAIRSSAQFSVIRQALEDGRSPKVAVVEHPLRVSVAVR